MNTQDKSEINIGIDTGQAILDIHVRPQGHFQFFENNSEGIRAAIRFIKPFKPTRILIEATGRLEVAFFCAAHKAGLPVCVCFSTSCRGPHVKGESFYFRAWEPCALGVLSITVRWLEAESCI